MAVGDYVWDQTQPPPLLIKALNYEKWGIGDINSLPAGILSQMNTALNYYHAMSGYRSAPKSSDWSKRNPGSWDLVSWYLAQRMERIRGNRNQ